MSLDTAASMNVASDWLHFRQVLRRLREDRVPITGSDKRLTNSRGSGSKQR